MNTATDKMPICAQTLAQCTCFNVHELPLLIAETEVSFIKQSSTQCASVKHEKMFNCRSHKHVLHAYKRHHAVFTLGINVNALSTITKDITYVCQSLQLTHECFKKHCEITQRGKNYITHRHPPKKRGHSQETHFTRDALPPLCVS